MASQACAYPKPEETVASFHSSHSATDLTELKLRDVPENISDAVLHEFLSTVTTLYYRKASAFAANPEWTREEIPLQLRFDSRDHSGKTDGALQVFALELGVWKKVDDNILVVVENKRVKTGGRGRRPEICRNVRGYSCVPQSKECSTF